jgi:enediyne biosynthesis protein E4
MKTKWLNLVVVGLLASCGTSGTSAGPDVKDVAVPLDISKEVDAGTFIDAIFELTDLLSDTALDGGDLTPDLLPTDSSPETADGYTYEPPDCPVGTQWTPGTPIFVERTEEWGLSGVLATRLNVTDLDGDGWPDLLVRIGGGPEDFGPEGNRTRWLLRNTGDGSFEDVTEASNLFLPRNEELANGARPGEVMASADVDNDGDLDIYTGTAVHVVEEGQETIELMINDGTGVFELGPVDSELRRVGQKSVIAGAAFVDVDRDGNVDLWTVHNMASEASSPLPDNLYLGDGTGMFVDVSKDAGIQTMSWMFPFQLNEALGHSWAWSAAACDLNNDGVTELLAASYGRCPNHLWQGEQLADGWVEFENVSVYSGYAYDHRMDWTDNESARCFCKLNPEAEDCAGVPPPEYMVCETEADIFRWSHESDREPWRLAGNSAATECADMDNDGNVDLLTGEIVHWDVGSSSDPAELLFNSGEDNVRMERPGNEVTGLTREHPGPIWDNGDMTNTVLDFDNDGLLDVYVGSSDYPYTRGLLFHQQEHRSFEPVAIEDAFEHLRSHGVVTADFDRDGDMDMVIGHSKHRCGDPYLDDCYETSQMRFFENVLGNVNGNWVSFRLVGGVGTNRAAIGARVTVTAGCHSYLRDVDGGHGHFGTQRDLVLHFGVGDAETLDVTVRWPDSDLTEQSFVVDSNKFYLVTQGAKPEAY